MCLLGSSSLRNGQLDAYGWRPLTTEHDYEATERRLEQEVFADEIARLRPGRGQGPERGVRALTRLLEVAARLFRTRPLDAAGSGRSRSVPGVLSARRSQPRAFSVPGVLSPGRSQPPVALTG